MLYILLSFKLHFIFNGIMLWKFDMPSAFPKIVLSGYGKNSWAFIQYIYQKRVWGSPAKAYIQETLPYISRSSKDNVTPTVSQRSLRKKKEEQ